MVRASCSPPSDPHTLVVLPCEVVNAVGGATGGHVRLCLIVDK